MNLRATNLCSHAKTGLLALLFAMPATGMAEIIWSGDFSTGDFRQWHNPTDPDGTAITFHQVKPVYGRPIQYGGQHEIHIGNGDLLSLVAATERTVDGILYPKGPTRGASEYAAKFTVKNSKNGSEPADCDGSVCTRRRTNLTLQAALQDVYNGMPYLAERWWSVSFYVPSNWSDAGSGFGVSVFSLKPRIEGGGGVGSTGIFGINIESGVWRLNHRWSPRESSPQVGEDPWQYGMFYTGKEDGAPYPRSDFWRDGLAHFPDVAASHAALQSLNKGGWTDWVVNIKTDHRGAGEGGTGFLNVWKREGSGQWVHVLAIKPGRVERGGMTFDHGIGYGPGSKGYGPKAGMYMGKDQVWNLPENRVLYIANLKVADENSTFADLSPDRSSPGSSADGDALDPSPPKPPVLDASD